MPFQLYNTMTRRLEAFQPADPGRISFYTCGPTVYDDAHIGNFRSFLAADVLRRWLESPLCELENDTRPDEARGAGRTVVHVMNLTDVGHMTDDSAADGGGEDKMAVAGQRLAEAKKAGKIPADAAIDANDPVAVADFFADRFIEDAQMLGLKVAKDAAKDPSLMPRASANITGMQRLITALIDKGCAYVAGELGSRAVYFSVESFPSYGVLSGNTLEHLKGGAGGRVTDETQRQKKHPADFLLWKEDASHLMKWDSPWGTGYPGWHIECSVMALDRLVPGGLSRVLGVGRRSEPTSAPDLAIDLHSGGEDNIFPHHECERAQSCCVLGGDRFARFWFHARFLMVDGAKMSKSRGTMYTPRQLFNLGHEPAAVRLELIKAHYRTNADFSLQGLKDSAKMVERWRRFVGVGRLSEPTPGTRETSESATGASSIVGSESRPTQDTATVRAAFAAAMNSDLNIAEAIGVINKWINETPAPGGADAALMAEFDAVLGLLSLPRLETKSEGLAVYLPGTEPSDTVAALLEQRAAARKNKDFARSDAIRDELAAMGYAIKDIAGGKVEVGPAS